MVKSVYQQPFIAVGGIFGAGRGGGTKTNHQTQVLYTHSYTGETTSISLMQHTISGTHKEITSINNTLL